MATITKPITIYVAHLPEVFGYGVIGYGTTPKEAEAACRKEYRKNDAGPGTGWDTHTRTWAATKEYYGFSISVATTGTAHLEGCGEYVELD